MRVSGCESQARIRIPSSYFAGEPVAVEVLAELDGAEPESLPASVDPDAEFEVALPEPSVVALPESSAAFGESV